MKRKPTNPGEILYEEFLAPLGLTRKALAEHIGCDYIDELPKLLQSQTVNRLLFLKCQFGTFARRSGAYSL